MIENRQRRSGRSTSGPRLRPCDRPIAPHVPPNSSV